MARIPAWLLALAGFAACGRLGFDSHSSSTDGQVQLDPTPHLVTGDDHTCVRTGTSLACWGQNDYGQLGEGTITNRVERHAVPGFDAIDFALGQNHTCAIDLNHRLWCWGANPDGELGCAPDCDATTVARSPVMLPDTRTYARIWANDFHTCAIADADASVWCWGNNGDGELGVGDTTGRASPTRVVAAGSDRYTRLALGNNHTCGEQDDGTVWCWGLTAALGIGSNAGTRRVPTRVPMLSGLADFDAGADYSCAIAHGDVVCWGGNGMHELGIADLTTQLAPIANGRTGATKLVAGLFHACAVASGGLECWGENTHGGLGVGTVTPSEISVAAIPGDWVELSAGDRFTCALTATAEVYCWGVNGSGQLGNGDTTDVSVPALAH